MNATTLLFTEIAISLATSLIVLYLVSGSLKAALLDLCPNQAQAGFWLSYARVMLLIAPLLLVLLIDGVAEGDTLAELRTAFIAALAGMLLGLINLGKKMYIPVERQTRRAGRDDKA